MIFRKTRKTGAIKKLGLGRVCKKHKCKQRLSIYNFNEYCHVHRSEVFK